MKRKIAAGLTGVTLPIFVSDTTSATGAGLSLAYNAPGLVAEYRRQGAPAWTAFPLAAGTLGMWSPGGWAADGALTGAYEVGLPDAAVAAGARWVAVRFRGAANMLPVLAELELDAVNYQDAARFGLSALPAAAAGVTGGVPVLGGTAVDANLTRVGGAAIPTPAVAGVPVVDIGYVLGTAAVATAGTIDANVVQWNGTAAGGAPNSGAVTVGGYAAGQDPAALVLDAAASAHAAAGSIGALVNAAGAATDPWAAALPGAYAAGTAGYVVGRNLDAAVSSRSTFAGGAVASVAAPVTVNAVNGQAPPANWGALAISPGGAVTAGLVTDKAGYSLQQAPPTAAQVRQELDANSTQIAALLAGQASLANGVANITSNTARTVFVLPGQMPAPASGSTAFEIDLVLFDLKGNNENADAPPVVHSRNVVGVSRDDHLSANAMTPVPGSTGRYKVTYAVQSSDPHESLIFDFSATVGGVTRTVSGATAVVPDLSLTFTAADRAVLNALPTAAQTAAAILADPTHPIVTDAAGRVTAGVVSDKSGYTLAPTGLDAIPVADPGAPVNQTTLPRMMVSLWRRAFRKTTLTASALRTYADDGVTVNSSQPVSDDGTTQTVGAAS